MVLSKEHKDVFSLKHGYFIKFGEQTQINYNAQKLKIPIYDIGFKFNHTTAPRNSEDRFESYIIHYPGKGHGHGTTAEQIRDDLRIIKNEN